MLCLDSEGNCLKLHITHAAVLRHISSVFVISVIEPIKVFSAVCSVVSEAADVFVSAEELSSVPQPDGCGLDLCARIKELRPETYIVFLTANDKESDMLRGYEAGGADYITKPFSIAVLCKKVAAVFANLKQLQPEQDIFDDGFLQINFSAQSADLNGKTIEFTPKEYRTLQLFVKNPRLILTKRQMLERLWDVDQEYVDEHTLTTIISRLRKKIETDERKYIKTAYGMGYQWMGGEIK